MKNTKQTEPAGSLVPERETRSNRITLVLGAVLIFAVAVGCVTFAAGDAGEISAPIFVKEIPTGYRDWKVVTVAHEAGDLNDIRAVLGNDIAIKAYREGKLPFPEGAIVGRIAWSHVASEENNKTFGRDQSFIAGAPTDSYLQFMVKDSKKFAATGGWGYSSFDQDGKPTPEAAMQSCFPCHQAVKSRDYVFARYTP
jgi:hypothetical protein